MPSDARNAGGSIRASGRSVGLSPEVRDRREELAAFSLPLSLRKGEVSWASMLLGGFSVYR
jgi:hypothetical protein